MRGFVYNSCSLFFVNLMNTVCVRDVCNSVWEVCRFPLKAVSWALPAGSASPRWRGLTVSLCLHKHIFFSIHGIAVCLLGGCWKEMSVSSKSLESLSFRGRRSHRSVFCLKREQHRERDRWRGPARGRMRRRGWRDEEETLPCFGPLGKITPEMGCQEQTAHTRKL